jgi:hypothetical protein
MPSEFPRLYTSAELKVIAHSVCPFELTSSHVESLQEAFQKYQWARLSDEREVLAFFASSTNKGRRGQLKHIIELCKRETRQEEIEQALSELDAIASQSLGPVDVTDRRQLRCAAESALRKIPTRGPNPKRARRQYIADLHPIFVSVTGQRPGRRFHDKEYGPFLDFVKAALDPFKAAQGCEADIKVVLKGLNDT